MKQFTFKKAEHLCLKTDIDALFLPGSKSFPSYPVRVVYRLLPWEGGAKVKVLMSAPKKKLKRAVDRNRVKRLLREAYRLNKSELLDAVPEGLMLHVGFLWLSGKVEPWTVVENKVKRLLRHIVDYDLGKL